VRKFATAILILSSMGMAATAREYHGADAGTLVISLGIMHGNKGDYRLEYKSADGSTDSEISYIPTSILEDADDYQNDGDETGQVQIRHLKPGSYAFYTFSAVDALTRFTPREEFAVPFKIEPGATTYVGDFAGVMPFIGNQPLGAYFVLSDKHDRDLAIARRKEPGLMPVTISVPDAAALHIPQIRAREVGPMPWEPGNGAR
jgi:hypothetical protein